MKLSHHGGGLRLLVGLVASCALCGCAAVTNPLAEGIPVRRLPPELLAPPRDAQPVALNLLGQPRPDGFRLAPGDVLGVYVEGVLGDRNQPLPIHLAPQFQVREQRRLPPAIGYPVPVREDGTISLPFIDPVQINGLTVAGAEAAVRDAYVKKGRVKPDTDRVMVSLIQERQYDVVVLREEAAGFLPGPDGPITTSKSGTGAVLELPAYQNDVLHALGETGGPPGVDVYDEVLVYRDAFRDARAGEELLRSLEGCAPGLGASKLAGLATQVTRIPLRLPPGERLSLRPEDVILGSGDVVYIPARHGDLFYTAGLLPPGAHLLPRDHSLDVIEAIAQVRGPLLNGAFGGSNLSGTLIQPGIGNPSPSLLVVLRRTPGGGQVPIVVDLNRALCDAQERIRVQPGDVLVLQEQPSEAFARYFTQTFLNFNLVWTVIHDRFATGVIDVAAPDRLSNGRLGTVTIPP